MTKSKRLKPVVKIAEDRERAAARLMGDSQRLVDERQARLDELIAYRREYSAQFAGGAAPARSALQINDFRLFLQRLDEIIRQQQRLLDDSHRELEQKKQAWLNSRTKKAALEKAVTRFQADEYSRQARREQRESDDRVQRNPKISEEK
jgi:flagellar FliJ protein